jgi:CheY-like chemotaxis protein
MKSVTPTALLIDDSRLQRRANEIWLAKAGYHVITATDGEEGLQLARKSLPDVVLLDMILPRLSGPELLHALKQDPLTAGIPVIVLSSLPQSNASKLKSEGAAAYLEKSTLVTDHGGKLLVDTVAAVLNAAR